MTQRYVASSDGLTRPSELVEAAHPKVDQPIGHLLGELWSNTEKLVRQEFALASAELDAKLKKVKTEAAAAALGGVILHTGMLTLVAALILLLSQAVAAWVAALIVGVALSGAGFVLLKRHPRIGADELTPKHTVESVKKDVETFREATQ